MMPKLDIKIEAYNGVVDQDVMALLLLADPDPEMINRYLPTSEVLVASYDVEKVGVAVLANYNGEYELKNIAVVPKYQGRGLAKELVAAIKSRAKARGAKSLKVGTGNSSLDQLAFYQKSGFRIVAVRRDFFSQYDPAIYENGIRCQDLVILEVEL